MRCKVHCPTGHRGSVVVLLLGLLAFGGVMGVMTLAPELAMMLSLALYTVVGLCALGTAWLIWFWRREYASIRGSARGRLTRATGAEQDIPAQITAISGLQPASLETLEDTLDMPAIEPGGAQLRDEGFLGQDALERLMVRYHQKAGNGNGERPEWKQN